MDIFLVGAPFTVVFSLLKYTVSINSFCYIQEIRAFCCKVYKMPRTPVRYADNLVTGCTNKAKMDLVINSVYKHVWNAK